LSPPSRKPPPSGEQASRRSRVPIFKRSGVAESAMHPPSPRLLAAAGAALLAVLGLTASPAATNVTITDLGTLGGGYSYARAINAAGQVVGYGQTSAATDRAFLAADGRLVALGTLGGTISEATAINASGQVVGGAFVAGDRVEHAVLFANETLTDLG